MKCGYCGRVKLPAVVLMDKSVLYELVSPVKRYICLTCFIGMLDTAKEEGDGNAFITCNDPKCNCHTPGELCLTER